MTIQNIKNAIKYAIGTSQGKKELTKTSFRDKDGKIVYRNPSMAQALELAAHGIPNRLREEASRDRANNAELFCKKVKQKKQMGNHPKEPYAWLQGKRK